VNGSDRHALIVQIVINHVALDLGVSEDQGALRLIREDEVDQGLVLGALLDEDDLLLDVGMRAANTSNLDFDTCTKLVYVSYAVRT
jgi:hypothetical protein